MMSLQYQISAISNGSKMLHAKFSSSMVKSWNLSLCPPTAALQPWLSCHVTMELFPMWTRTVLMEEILSESSGFHIFAAVDSWPHFEIMTWIILSCTCLSLMESHNTSNINKKYLIVFLRNLLTDLMRCNTFLVDHTLVVMGEIFYPRTIWNWLQSEKISCWDDVTTRARWHWHV